MLLGCIADDLTGATDLSLMLSRAGLRTLQTTGLPADDLDAGDVDAIVVALKSRTIAAEEAIAQSLAAAEAHSASISNIARRSIPPMPAILARSPMP